MAEPLVSVLIPVYNHAKYVWRCLDSLLEDGWPNLEVLVVDDGSTDDSYEVVEQWRAEHPGAFSRFELNNQENQGITPTLNRLVSLARGQYITLLASDDYLLPGGIGVRVKSLEANPHWLAVFGDAAVVDDEGKPISESGLTQLYPKSARLAALKNPRLLPLELIVRWSVPGPVLLLRAEAYKTLGLYDESFLIEDRDYYLRLLAINALGFIHATVAAYRWHAQSTVRSPGEKQKRQLNNLALIAKKQTLQFTGLNRVALEVEYRRLKSTDWRGQPWAYKAGALAWRFLWKMLEVIQSARVATRWYLT